MAVYVLPAFWSVYSQTLLGLYNNSLRVLPRFWRIFGSRLGGRRRRVPNFRRSLILFASLVSNF